MADPKVNDGASPQSGLYLGLGADGEATGTGAQNKLYIDDDGDGKIDNPTNDNRGFGGGGELVAAYFLRNKNTNWGGDFKLTFGAGYRFDPDGMQYFVPASHDAGMYGVTEDTSSCGASNCADVEQSTFGSFDLRVVPSATYRVAKHGAFAFGPALSGAYYWQGEPDKLGAYAPITTRENGEILPTDGTEPLTGAIRVGGEIGYIQDLGGNGLFIPKLGLEYGVTFSGDDNATPGGWMARAGVELRIGTRRSDADHDGLKLPQELIYTTDPKDPDTDEDGLKDGTEDKNKNGTHDTGETDALDPDTDDDGLKDGTEDANHDGIKDPTETDPLNPDTDGDGLLDGVEDANKNGVKDDGETDPLNPDTDDDGLKDGTEDANHDGVRDDTETDPLNPDTDTDRLYDGVEVQITGTDPLDPDHDDDRLIDGIEQPEAAERNPLQVTESLTDTDGDGNVNAKSPDDDGDGVLTAQEIEDSGKPGDQGQIPGTDVDGDGGVNWLDPNADGDLIERDGDEADDVLPANGVADYLEVSLLDTLDSDGDGLTDIVEQGDAKKLAGAPEASDWEDVDGDGNKNWHDTDSDGDTLLDNNPPVGEGRVDGDHDGIPAYLDKKNIKVTIEGKQINYDGVIKFKVNSAELRLKDAETIEALQSLLETLKENPQIGKVSIEGHTSLEGSEAYNQSLSERRAASVVAYLVQYGANPENLESIGFGETRPKVDESLGKTKKEIEELRKENRRTELRIADKQPDVVIDTVEDAEEKAE